MAQQDSNTEPNEQDRDREAVVLSLFADITMLRDLQRILVVWFDKHGYEINNHQGIAWSASLKSDIEANKTVVNDRGMTITYFNHKPIGVWETYVEMVDVLLERIGEQGAS